MPKKTEVEFAMGCLVRLKKAPTQFGSVSNEPHLSLNQNLVQKWKELERRISATISGWDCPLQSSYAFPGKARLLRHASPHLNLTTPTPEARLCHMPVPTFIYPGCDYGSFVAIDLWLLAPIPSWDRGLGPLTTMG